jgi:hypothetical protein
VQAKKDDEAENQNRHGQTDSRLKTSIVRQPRRLGAP